MKRILIAGGSGLIGTALSREAASIGYEVVLLSRSSGSGKITWDPAAHRIEVDQPQSFEAIVNLAGSNISGGRWTDRRKEDIVRSRVNSCHTIQAYLQKGLLQTKVYVGASGVGYYRNSGEAVVDENTTTQFADDWLVQTVMQWEEAHQAISKSGIRTVITRFGIVLSKEGGALKEVLNPATFGVLAYFGAGQQYWPWIHIQDVARILIYAIEQDDMKGIFLAVSPKAVRNKSLTKTIHQQLSPPRIMIPVPRFVLRLMLGEMHSVVFDSCHAIPKRLMESNYTFLFPEMENAMKDLLRKKKGKE